MLANRLALALLLTNALPRTEAAPAGTDCLVIDYQRSWIEIEAHALGFIPSVLRFRSFSAKVCLDAAISDLSVARFELLYGQLTSGSEGRDRKVAQWLEAESYPNGYYELQAVSRVGESDLAEGPLSLHGEAHNAQFRYEIVRDGLDVTLKAVSKIDYREWGLPLLRIFIFNVDPTLTIRLSISGTVGTLTESKLHPE